MEVGQFAYFSIEVYFWRQYLQSVYDLRICAAELLTGLHALLMCVHASIKCLIINN